MQPDSFRFGGGSAGSVMHPVVAAAMLLTIVLTFALQRKYVIVPFLFAIFVVPYGQNFVLGGVHLFVARIIILAGWVRLLSSRPTSASGRFAGGVNGIDKAFIGWAVAHAVAFSLLYRDPSAVVNQVAFLWDSLGGYFLLRFLVRDEDDVRRVVRTLAAIAAFLGVFMLREQLTGMNVFGLLSGQSGLSEVRDGRIRSQGPFAHALLAGAFGSTLVPFFFWLWKEKGSRLTSRPASSRRHLSSGLRRAALRSSRGRRELARSAFGPCGVTCGRFAGVSCSSCPVPRS